MSGSPILFAILSVDEVREIGRWLCRFHRARLLLRLGVAY